LNRHQAPVGNAAGREIAVREITILTTSGDDYSEQTREGKRYSQRPQTSFVQNLWTSSFNIKREISEKAKYNKADWSFPHALT
jgi:hypothetical protein